MKTGDITGGIIRGLGFRTIYCRYLSYMRKVLLLSVLVFLLPVYLYSGSIVRYILPESIAYTGPSFDSAIDCNIFLSFGEEIPVTGVLKTEGITWYRCTGADSTFFLPDVFIDDSVLLMPAGIAESGNVRIGSSMVDRRFSLPLDYVPDDLVPVPLRYKAPGYESRHLLLRREALDVFMYMIDDAGAAGVNIRILSAYRDAYYQSRLYFNAIKRHGVFQNSVAKPGHSEHQLGTACDLTTNEIGSALSGSFDRTAAFRWLMDHMTDYGISLSYPKYKETITGYVYEPWHYRYWGKERWITAAGRLNLFFTR